MCTEVYKHQHIETGGNLFGLWTTSGSAVIQVVLGPGKNCRRTETSFHQDIEYMNRVGRFVKDNYMFCHIGEWCSQHSLSLNKPSSGDEQTIRRSFPQGVTKFLVIFANIRNTDTIVLSPYFFTDEGRRYEKAEYVLLNSNGPFSHDSNIAAQIHLGAEWVKHQLTESDHGGASLTAAGNARNTHLDSQQSVQACSTCLRGPQEKTPNAGFNLQPRRDSSNRSTHLHFTSAISQPSKENANSIAAMWTSNTETHEGGQTPKIASHNGDSSNNTKTRQNMGSKSQRDDNTSSTYIQANQSSTPSKPEPSIHVSKDSVSLSQVDPRKPKFKYDQSISNSQVNQSQSKSKIKLSGSTAHGNVELMDTDNDDLFRLSTPRLVMSQADPDKNKNGDNETPSEREIALKKIHDQLKHWFGTHSESGFSFETSKDCSGAIEISFKHNRKFWMVRFPKGFPADSTEIFCSQFQ